MAFKLFIFAAVVAVARAGLIAEHGYASPLTYAAPVAKVVSPLAYAAPAYAKVAAPLAYAAPVAKYAHAEEYAHPQYDFAYDIQDGLTGDSKSQHESRDGDVVHGSYSLIDADGYKRTVDYTADDHNGFNAVVRREPLGHAVKVAAPVAYAAPVAKYAAPLAYAAPVAKYAAPLAYAAPVAKYAAPLAYAAPVAKYAAPLAYSAPVVKYAAPLSYAAPVAKYAVPQAYAAPSYYHH